MFKNIFKEKLMRYLGILMVLFMLVGCGGSKDITVTIQPDGNKMAYATTEFKVKTGQNVTLIMDNTATIEVMKHNVVILNDPSKVNEIGQKAITAPGNLPKDPAIIAATPMADAGSKTEVTFVAPKPGRYTFICTYPGHYAMMKGIMIVE